MNVVGGSILVINDLQFVPEETNVLYSSYKPLSVAVSYNVFGVHLLKTALISTIVTGKTNKGKVNDKITFSTSKRDNYVKLRIINHEARAASSFKLILEKAKALVMALQEKERFFPEQVKTDTFVVTFTPANTGVKVTIDQFTFTPVFFDLADCYLIKKTCWTVLSGKIKKIYFDKGNSFKIATEEEVVRGENFFSPEKVSFYLYDRAIRIPLSVNNIIKILSVF